MSILAERLLAVHAALDAARIPHAFGGAIALAFCTAEPRGTRDIDVNVFVSPKEAARVLDALPDDVVRGPDDLAALERDGQVRVHWRDTPVDLFLDVHDFHRAVRARVRVVPFVGTDIPALDCLSLVIFKAMFNRTKDWGDIEAIIEERSIDVVEACDELARLLGDDDPAVIRLAGLARPAAE
jgi:hypothetical protein